MKLLAITEHFPSPYKAYHYVQFDHFLREGHELDVYAFGKHEGGMGTSGEGQHLKVDVRSAVADFNEVAELRLHDLAATYQLA